MSLPDSPGCKRTERVWIHLDMKGAPPTVPYLLALFPYLARWGATGLLIEWEDMLPWSGSLEALKHTDAYTPDEVHTILQGAAANGLEVVPLIQTFGHLEFVLKHDAFAEFRESPDSFMDLCPSHPGAFDLVKELIKQVLSFHAGTRFLHIGCDEVFGIGTCGKCAQEVAAVGVEGLYLRHVVPILAHCATLGVTPLIWHDMIEKFSLPSLSLIAKHAECVVWSYARNMEDFIDPTFWPKAEACGLALWGASAFKGAANPDAVWCPLHHYAWNHHTWMARARTTPLRGIIMTGWSRFTHFASLCELLPAAVPSLALCLAIVNARCWDVNTLTPVVMSELGMPTLPAAFNFKSKLALEPGNFPGADLFRILAHLEYINVSFQRCSESIRMYTPPYTHRLDPGMWRRLSKGLVNVMTELTNLSDLTTVLSKYIRPASAAEFVSSKVTAVFSQAIMMVDGLQKLQHAYPCENASQMTLMGSDAVNMMSCLVPTASCLLGLQSSPTVPVPVPDASPTAHKRHRGDGEDNNGVVVVTNCVGGAGTDGCEQLDGIDEDSDMGSEVRCDGSRVSPLPTPVGVSTRAVSSDSVVIRMSEPLVKFNFGNQPLSPRALPVTPTSSPMRTMNSDHSPRTPVKLPSSPQFLLTAPALALELDTAMLSTRAVSLMVNVTTTVSTVLSDAIPVTSVSVMSPTTMVHPVVTVVPSIH